MDSWSCHLDALEPLIQRSALFTQHTTVFHGGLRWVESQVLAEAARWGSKLVQLCLDLKALQLSFIMDLGERNTT